MLYEVIDLYRNNTFLIFPQIGAALIGIQKPQNRRVPSSPHLAHQLH